MPLYKNTDKQKDAVKILSDKKHTDYMLFGASRSGKTFILIRAIIIRACKEPNSTHCIIRRTQRDVRQKIIMKTIPDVLRLCFPSLEVDINKSDLYVLFPNGSKIICAGLDSSGEKHERILGSEFSTLYFNECTEIDWESVLIAKTRLAEKNNLKKVCYYDCNPTIRSYWAFKYFIDNKDPITDKPVENTAYLQMNTVDNLDNIDPEYIKILESLPLKQRNRFYLGQWSDEEEGTLFQRTTINRNRVNQIPELREIIIAVDPAISVNKNSCETGVVTIGLSDDEQFYVLNDLSGKYTPDEWVNAVYEEYNIRKCNSIVAEINQGGDLVEHAIKSRDKSVKVNQVRATRGKAIRAEPVSALYERNYIHHVGVYPELEDEMCMFGQSTVMSDRFDALVWGITYLSEKCISHKIPTCVCFDDNQRKSPEEIIKAREESMRILQDINNDIGWEDL